MAKEFNYSVTYLPLKNLSVVWAKAQRPFNEKWARQLAEEFDPDKFEPIIVTKPNGVGTYHIIEGQHRKSAAEAFLGNPNQTVPCHVVDHADPARAAEIWLGINKGRKAIRPVVAFMVAVEAKRDVEVAINNIVIRSGYHVGENTSGQNIITAVGALRKIYNSYGGKILAHTLDACRLLWGSDPHGSNGSMIIGLGMFLNEFGDQVDPKRLRSVVQDKYSSPWKLIDAANTFKEKASEQLDFSISELVRTIYNKSLKDQSKRLKRKEI